MTDTPKCTCFLLRSAFSSDSFPTFKMSTQKLVVSAVSAESALEKAAAIIPMVKHINTGKPKCPSAANIGKISSPALGIDSPICGANNSNRMPNVRNR